MRESKYGFAFLVNYINAQCGQSTYENLRYETVQTSVCNNHNFGLNKKRFCSEIKVKAECKCINFPKRLF